MGRFYDIQSGKITLNGQNIHNLPLEQVRQSIAVIPQFGFLFKGTLRENLDPQKETTDEKIRSILESTNLHLWSAQNEENILEGNGKINLDFKIENNGSNLSNGEKQIINFLRVFIQSREIICLDEASSNIDSETDDCLMKALFEGAGNKTVIMISHRLENLRSFDRIFVLDKGQLVEEGSFEKLSSNPESHFNLLRNLGN
eukprot:TRINITY_DN8183_c0_g1_i2.p1 TRINITY_DN8183_c0_g1~~TRINITY_DN8183_c0_g1_i2.p1  ORF type:complete len:214 (+),score=57.18 TRINITY_DN8183_c0_g1_i2:41-643(+)